MQLEIGTIHTMTVRQQTKNGYVITKGSEQAMLPFSYTNKELHTNSFVDVFLYYDKKGQLVGTMQLPQVAIGVYDWVEVMDVIPKLGVFVNIGMKEEVLVSSDDLPSYQKAWPLPGDKLYVTLATDKKNRLLAVPATKKVFQDMYHLAHDAELNDKIVGRTIRVDREGAVIITKDENYRGFIHHTEREKELRLGELVTGRVIEVKEDGSLNVSLIPLKHERMDEDAARILTHLEKVGGVMPLGDKSDPSKIRKTFQMSKSAFKRALGRLMKEKKIEQHDGKTFLK